MNQAKVDLEYGDGTTHELKSETLDPLQGLWTPGEHAHARVSLSVGQALGYGELKVNASVSYECDQNEQTVDKAALLAFTKAITLATDAMRTLKGAGA
jgi:hypothetical protein